MALPDDFKALVVTETEDKQFVRTVEQKRIEDLPEGDVVVQVGYSSLNYKDVLSATGNRGVTRNFPHTPGIDAAGVVIYANPAAEDYFQTSARTLKSSGLKRIIPPTSPVFALIGDGLVWRRATDPNFDASALLPAVTRLVNSMIQPTGTDTSSATKIDALRKVQA